MYVVMEQVAGGELFTRFVIWLQKVLVLRANPDAGWVTVDFTPKDDYSRARN